MPYAHERPGRGMEADGPGGPVLHRETTRKRAAYPFLNGDTSRFGVARALRAAGRGTVCPPAARTSRSARSPPQAKFLKLQPLLLTFLWFPIRKLRLGVAASYFPSGSVNRRRILWRKLRWQDQIVWTKWNRAGALTAPSNADDELGAGALPGKASNAAKHSHGNMWFVNLKKNSVERAAASLGERKGLLDAKTEDSEQQAQKKKIATKKQSDQPNPL